MPAPPPTTRYRFGTFEADAATGEHPAPPGPPHQTRRPALPVPLAFLLDHPGDTPDPRSHLPASSGPTAPSSTSTTASTPPSTCIREALSDTASSPRFIETLARRGYRFIASVESSNPAALHPRTGTGKPPNLNDSDPPT